MFSRLAAGVGWRQWGTGATLLAGAVLCAALVAAPGPTDPVVRPGVISTGAAEVRISYRPDGRQIVWGSIGRGTNPDQEDIWEMHRVGGGWSQPARVSFDTDAVEFDPAFSADSRHLYFDSDRPGGRGGTDIYVVDVADYKFSTPRNVGDGVNSAGDEWAPAPNGTGTLLFSSDGWGGEGKHDLLEGDLQGSRKPRNLGPKVNSPEEDFDPALAPDRKTLVFSSGTMNDSVAHVRLFRSRYQNGAWTQREALPVGCSDFILGAAFGPAPGRLNYAAKCPGGPGRMDIHQTTLAGDR